MLVSNNPKRFYPAHRPQRTQDLDVVLSSFDVKMRHIKREWASSVLHYNLTSKAAYKHRFSKSIRKDGRQTADGMESEYTTAEAEFGSFVCVPLVKNKVDQYLSEFQMRDFACKSSSFANEEYKYLIDFLIRQSFHTPEFRTALTSAFKDALIKKIGYIRPRLYDVNRDIILPSLEADGKINTTLYKNKPIKNGLTIEYVDVENVFLDPNAKNPQEFFICTEYTIFELLSLYPQLNDLLYFTKDTQENEITDSYVNQNKKAQFPIRPKCIPNYKVGEAFTKWYYKPELFDTKQTNSPSVGTYNEKKNERKSFPFSGDNRKHNQNWDKYYFGEEYDNYTNDYALENGIYSVNEYYNIALNRYIIYIDEYILYDGEMLEPFKGEPPIQAIYFDHTESDGWFGKSVNDHIHTLQVEASFASTKAKQLLEVSSVTYIEVNTDRMQNANQTIDAGLVNFIQTQDGNLASNAPALTQLQIQSPGIELYPQYEQKYLLEAEKVFPSTEGITSQLSKEEREQQISSRNLRADYFLKYNAEQLSKFAYKMFACKLMELRIKSKSELVIELPVGGQILLVVRENEKDIIIAKKKITDLLTEQYNLTKENLKGQIASSPEFQQNIEKIKQDVANQFAQDIQRPEAQEQAQKDPNYQEKIKQDILKAQAETINSVLEEQVSQQLPPPEDKNWYITFENVSDLLDARKEFEFSFKNTSAEIKKSINDMLAVMAQIPLSEFALDYSKFAKELAISYGVNPEVILKQVAPATELTGIKNSKSTFYLDAQANPVGSKAFMSKVLNINEDETQFNADSSVIQGLMFIKDKEHQRELELVKAKVLSEAQSALVKDGNKNQAEIVKEQEKLKAQQQLANDNQDE